MLSLGLKYTESIVIGDEPYQSVLILKRCSSAARTCRVCVAAPRYVPLCRVRVTSLADDLDRERPAYPLESNSAETKWGVVPLSWSSEEGIVIGTYPNQSIVLFKYASDSQAYVDIHGQQHIFRVEREIVDGFITRNQFHVGRSGTRWNRLGDMGSGQVTEALSAESRWLDLADERYENASR